MKGDLNKWPDLHELALANDMFVKTPKNWFSCRDGDDLSGKVSNYLFSRAEDGRYYDIAKLLGLDSTAVSRGIALADIDNDGDMDMAFANQWDTSAYYINNSDSKNQSVVWELLIKTKAGALVSATGAMVLIMESNEKRLSYVDGGSGHSGIRSPQVHFGLGNVNSNKKHKVEVKWRDFNGETHLSEFMVASGNHKIILNESL